MLGLKYMGCLKFVVFFGGGGECVCDHQYGRDGEGTSKRRNGKDGNVTPTGEKDKGRTWRAEEKTAKSPAEAGCITLSCWPTAIFTIEGPVMQLR